MRTFSHRDGNDNVEKLSSHFQGIVADSIECIEEWSSFRQFMKENCSQMNQDESFAVILHGQRFIPT